MTTALDQSLVELRMIADTFTHAQNARIALENRARTGADPVFMAPAVAHYQAVEHEMGLALKKAMRKSVSPALRTWQRGARGIGDLSLARFLGLVGNPADRTLPQLWAYCGHGDPNRQRHKGMTRAEAGALGNPQAKKQVYEMAYNAMRQGIRRKGDGYVALSKYGQLYIDRRAATKGRIHKHDCPQCKSKAGTPWKDGHSHGDALRVVGKALLKDIWKAAQAPVA